MECLDKTEVYPGYCPGAKDARSAKSSRTPRKRSNNVDWMVIGSESGGSDTCSGTCGGASSDTNRVAFERTVRTIYG